MSDTSLVGTGAFTPVDLEPRVRNGSGSRLLVAAALIVAASLSAAPTPALASSRARVESSFRRFCSQWMHKLELREKRNAARMKYVRKGLAVVGEYSGYGRRPSSCQVQATGVAEAPYIGKLTYRENVYRKSGRSRGTARRSNPKILQSTEVLEIFRYNGRSWVY